MESGDGGTEENSERLNDIDGQPQQEQIGANLPEEVGSGDVLNETRAELQQSKQVPESREIERNAEGKEVKVIDNEGNNSFSQEEIDSNGSAMVANLQEVSRVSSIEKRHVSDEDSGENVVLPDVIDDPPPSEENVFPNQTAKENNGMLSLHNKAHSDAVVEAMASDNAGEESPLGKDETVKDKKEFSSASSDQPTMFKGNGEEDVDEELENFFQSAQAEVGKFPALDNVDLTSDDEGNGPREGETENNDNQGEVQSNDIAAVPREEDCYDDQGIIVVKRSDRKDYPLNYGNYTVCREVEPGVKECLILETGEHVMCVANTPASSTPSITTSVPISSSSPRNPVIKKNYNDGKADNSIPFANPAEAFAYVSFEEDVTHSMGGDADVSSQPLALDKNQQAFITENGIPVILDNAEDDVKLGLQDKMGHIGNYIHDNHSPTSGELEIQNSLEQMQVTESERVADVLSSGGEGDGGCQFNESTHVKKPKKKRDKKQKFYELQPDDMQDDTDDADRRIVLNRNSIHETERERENGNLNNNAFERESKRILRSPHRDLRGHDIGGRRFLSSDGSGSERVYSPSVRKTSFIDSGRQFTSGLENSYLRSGDRSTFDSSHMSTRYSCIDRGDPTSSSSTQESLTIPRFRTLHDQQVSWVEMFKMIEDQHRNELQSQYSEHQRILQDLQHKMELELTKQQDTLKHRLQTHKEILQELSPARHRLGRDVTFSPRVQDAPHEDLSQTTIDGVPVTLKYPPPLSGRFGEKEEDRTQVDHGKRESLGQASVRRSLEKELHCSSRHADSGDKLLRGGVFSSPMPLVKARQKKTKSGRSYENKSHNSTSNGLGQAGYAEQAPTSYSEERTNDASLTESDDVTSPRSRVSLREKHAKHVADLRAYYEEEMKEMRKILTSRQTGDDLSRDNVLASGDRILANENAELRQRCQELDDECHDLKIEVRELQQKIQGLEIRSADYAQRFDNSQSQVRSLHARLEELTEFAKEKEAEAADLKSKNKTSGDTLQLACKKEKELTDSLHAAKTTIQRIVEKYESLEKDQQLLKESLADKDEKLFLSRKEAMDANNKISRMELENKQLLHEKDILKHELTMARSSVANIHTTFEDAFSNTVPSSSRISRNVVGGMRSRSNDRSSRSLSRDRNRVLADPSPDSETESEVIKSPIIRAEKELMKLRESVGSSKEFAPKLQRKFYGTETSNGNLRGSSASSPGHCNKSKSIIDVPKDSSPRDKRGRVESINGMKTPGAAQTSKSRSRRSENNTTKLKESDGINDGNMTAERAVQGALKRLGIENGWSSEQALERVKAGEVVSRPAWEDMYTSMAPARSTGSGEKMSPAVKSTRDQMLMERIQNIDMLERKYDDLSNEKRKFESALSKVPVHGSRREKERLEAELDRVDRELGSVRMSLKRFHALKSTI